MTYPRPISENSVESSALAERALAGLSKYNSFFAPAPRPKTSIYVTPFFALRLLYTVRAKRCAPGSGVVLQMLVGCVAYGGGGIDSGCYGDRKKKLEKEK